MAFRFKTQLLGALLLTTVVSIVVSYMAFRTIQDFQTAMQWVAHSFAVKSDVESIQSSLSAAELSAQTYLITANPLFKKQFRIYEDSVESRFRKLGKFLF